MSVIDINFDNLRKLVDKVSNANGKKAEAIIISKKLQDKYLEFQTDKWEGLKIDICDIEDEKEVIYVR